MGTSKMHTAVKVAPQYASDEHPVIHALDASRAVTVVSSLLSEESKPDYVADVQDEYAELRDEYYASLEDRKYLTLDQAISKRGDVSTEKVAPVPSHLGARVVEEDLASVVPFIDWNPFFQTWELRGRYPNRGYPKIFNDETVGAEAKKLFDEAMQMLNSWKDNKSIKLRGIAGIYPAAAVEDDDIEVYLPEGDEARAQVRAKLYTLRQQAEKEDGERHFALADFVAPKESGPKDYVGMFVASAGFGLEEITK